MTLRELIDFKNEKGFQKTCKSYTIVGLGIIASSFIFVFMAVTNLPLSQKEFVKITGELDNFRQIEIGKYKMPNTLIRLKNHPQIEFNLDDVVSIHTINNYVENNSQQITFKLGVPEKELSYNKATINAHFIIEMNNDVIQSYEDYFEKTRSNQVTSLFMFFGMFAIGSLFILG